MTHTPALDTLNRAAIRCAMRVPTAFSGYMICPSHYWPTVEDGTEMRRFPAHPIIKWLARWLPIKPYVEMEVAKYRDADPMYDARNGALYCSYAQADTLRRRLGS